jgi:tRNA(Arg) A34 adenosine deaminase TadA
MKNFDEKFIRLAIELAKEARRNGADPFGALLVKDGKIVAKSMDRSVEVSDPTSHAELSVISEYCRKHRAFSLEGYTIYCSTEPCAMCAGAIHWARLSRVVYSVTQELLQQRSGGGRKITCERIIKSEQHHIEIVGPVLPEEGIAVFQGYTFEPKVSRHARLHGA